MPYMDIPTPRDWSSDDNDVLEIPTVETSNSHLAGQLDRLADSQTAYADRYFSEISDAANARSISDLKRAVAKLTRAQKQARVLREASYILERLRA